jgi:hypothetical protein
MGEITIELAQFFATKVLSHESGIIKMNFNSD